MYTSTWLLKVLGVSKGTGLCYLEIVEWGRRRCWGWRHHAKSRRHDSCWQVNVRGLRHRRWWLKQVWSSILIHYLCFIFTGKNLRFKSSRLVRNSAGPFSFLLLGKYHRFTVVEGGKKPIDKFVLVWRYLWWWSCFLPWRPPRGWGGGATPCSARLRPAVHVWVPTLLSSLEVHEEALFLIVVSGNSPRRTHVPSHAQEVFR